jgi:asparagine synthase (glutamine-hydrolysing)
MNMAIAHRGPDGDGEFVHGGVALGHRRLSILDLSELGAQPMHSQDQTQVLVFNGEIYNYLELKAELIRLGRVFRTHSDTEVLLHAYEAWGPRCVERFLGMWAFAIWDVRRRTLFASRDRFGVKPFYFAQTASRFVFSSEIKGLGAAVSLHAANLGKVYEYLAYGYRTNDGETFFEGVAELLPAHNLFIEDGKVRMVRYWQLPPQAEPSVNEAELREHMVSLVEDAVRLRFRSDVPVALLQSGGLDSSIICRIVDDSIESGRLASPSITAYTAVFPGYGLDESETVRELIAGCRHVQLREITACPTNLPDQLPDFVRGMGEPVFNSTVFMHCLLTKAIHDDGAKVVINGQGADEGFAGYGRLIAGYRLLDLLFSAPAQIWHQANALHDSLPCGFGYLLAQTGKAVLGRRRASYLRAGWKEHTFDVLNPAFRHQHDGRLVDTSDAVD